MKDLQRSRRGGYFGSMSVHLTAVEEAERAGFDLSLLDANLSYSYEKRALLHDAALDLALELERIGRQLRGEPQRIAPAPVRR